MSNPVNLQKLAFTLREVAALTGISERSLWTQINTGKLPSVRVGRCLRVLRKDLDAFLESSKPASDPA